MTVSGVDSVRVRVCGVPATAVALESHASREIAVPARWGQPRLGLASPSSAPLVGVGTAMGTTMVEWSHLMDGKEVGFTVRLFREGETYVAHVPELDISSCGDTEAETRRNIKDAVAGFLNTAEEQGTLEQILEEAGYRLEGGRWREPEVVSTERMQVRVA